MTTPFFFPYISRALNLEGDQANGFCFCFSFIPFILLRVSFFLSREGATYYCLDKFFFIKLLSLIIRESNIFVDKFLGQPFLGYAWFEIRKP